MFLRSKWKYVLGMILGLIPGHVFGLLLSTTPSAHGIYWDDPTPKGLLVYLVGGSLFVLISGYFFGSRFKGVECGIAIGFLGGTIWPLVCLFIGMAWIGVASIIYLASHHLVGFLVVVGVILAATCLGRPIPHFPATHD